MLNKGVFKRGGSPSFYISSPSPLKERGTKGVRLINDIKSSRISV